MSQDTSVEVTTVTRLAQLEERSTFNGSIPSSGVLSYLFCPGITASASDTTYNTKLHINKGPCIVCTVYIIITWNTTLLVIQIYNDYI